MAANGRRKGAHFLANAGGQREPFCAETEDTTDSVRAPPSAARADVAARLREVGGVDLAIEQFRRAEE